MNLESASELLNNAGKIAIIGNGGNLAIAQHAASDIYRHTGKFTFSPNAVELTAMGGDGDWKFDWVEYAEQNADLIIGITCRVNSPIASSLVPVNDISFLIAPESHGLLRTLVLDYDTYHELEVNTLMTFYKMMEYIGVKLPKLPHVRH